MRRMNWFGVEMKMKYMCVMRGRYDNEFCIFISLLINLFPPFYFLVLLFASM